MITEGEAAILLETTRRALGNQSQSKQRLTLDIASRARIFEKGMFYEARSSTLLFRILFSSKE